VHSLPNIDYTKNCRDCGALVLFSSEVVTSTGMKIPIEKDGRRHTCEPNEEFIISRCIEQVAAANRRLQTCQLRIVREEGPRQ